MSAKRPDSDEVIFIMTIETLSLSAQVYRMLTEFKFTERTKKI